jgi:hypothetical protein
MTPSHTYFGITSPSVVPAQAGTHIPEAFFMGPRLRGDDSDESDSV